MAQAKQSGGWQTMIGIALLGIVAYQTFFPAADAPQPAPPAPQGTVDLVSVFRESDDRAVARAHCHAFGALCAEMAGRLEYDSQQSTPRLTTGLQVDDLRISLRQFMLDGKSFGAAYPRLRDTLRQHFTPLVGTDSGPLTADQRTKWIQAYRELAASAEYAVGRL